MLFFTFLFFYNIFCFEKNNSIYNNRQNTVGYNNIKQKIFKNESKRRLEQPFEPIKIKIDTNCLGSSGSLVEIINKALDKSKSTLESLIKVQKSNEFIQLPSNKIDNNINRFNSCLGRNIYNDKSTEDLVIYIRRLDGTSEDLESLKPNNVNEESFWAKPNIYHSINDRPVIGTVVYNEFKMNSNNLPEQMEQKMEQKIELLSIIFLHQFTHILGFNKNLLLEKNIIKESVCKSRLNNSESVHKFVVISESFLKLSRTYFNCSNLTSLELDSEINLRDFEDLHWESRLLLGDYMTGDIYYLDQVISEFTLALLDSFDFYEINYYTGGLMNFGKNFYCLIYQKVQVRSH